MEMTSGPLPRSKPRMPVQAGQLAAIADDRAGT